MYYTTKLSGKEGRSLCQMQPEVFISYICFWPVIHFLQILRALGLTKSGSILNFNSSPGSFSENRVVLGFSNHSELFHLFGNIELFLCVWTERLCSREPVSNLGHLGKCWNLVFPHGISTHKEWLHMPQPRPGVVVSPSTPSR